MYLLDNAFLDMIVIPMPSFFINWLARTNCARTSSEIFYIIYTLLAKARTVGAVYG
jgi:hypothetical protein